MQHNRPGIHLGRHPEGAINMLHTYGVRPNARMRLISRKEYSRLSL